MAHPSNQVLGLAYAATCPSEGMSTLQWILVIVVVLILFGGLGISIF